MNLRTLDLFCGCGGLSLGFQNAGFEIVAAFDHWKPALDTYTRNFLHPAFECDLGELEDFSQLARLAPNIIIGGPPCQDFSSAGKRNVDLGRADLTIQFAKIVASLVPTWFIMENVELAVKSKAFSKAKTIFQTSGYGLSTIILDASLCGVPQRRKRLFVVGQLGGSDHALETLLLSRLASQPMTIQDYFGSTLGLEFYYRHPRSYARRGIFSITEPSPTIRGVNRPIPATYQLHPTDPVESLDGVRPLTTFERAQVQTFPKDFEFIGTKSVLEQQIGNAVPVNMAAYVAQCLLEFMRHEPVQKPLFALV